MPMPILNSMIANFDVGPAFCKTETETNKQANLEEKYQMKSHPALNFELNKEEKTRQIEMEVEKKCRKLLID